MNFEEFILEGNKSGDSSLHDWFNKSKSSDGTKGWVQLGGKYAGKPCARQEGQTTKPKCGSSKMKKDLNKKEEDAAFRRKNREDGNPDRSGKAKNVRTEGKTYDQFISEKVEKDESEANAPPHSVVAIIKTPNKGGKGLDVLGGFKKKFKPGDLGRSSRLEI